MGAGQMLLFTLRSSGAGELRAVYSATALPLPKSLAGHGVNSVVPLSCEHSSSISGGKRGIKAAKGQQKENPLPTAAPICTAARAATSPAARACLPGAATLREADAHPSTVIPDRKHPFR